MLKVVMFSLLLHWLTAIQPSNAGCARAFLLFPYSRPCWSVTQPTAFAGGGFGGGGNGEKRPLRPKKKIKKFADAIDECASTDKAKFDGKSNDAQPKLDRFGLPLPTVDDIFPSMPSGTEIMGAREEQYQPQFGVSQEELDEILSNHLSVNLSNLKGSPGGADMKARILHRSPPVIAIDNFFTSQECEECFNLVGRTQQDEGSTAFQVNSATFSPMAQSKRTSTTWFCHYAQMPTLLAKAKHLLNIEYEQCEEPQLVRYRPGEEFTWHYDEVPAPQLPNGGQRIATLLVYLNTLDEGKGGQTIFRDLCNPGGGHLTMKPEKGSLLIFFPAFKDGRPDDRTLHRGDVAIDEKFVSQMWIHERHYSPVVPEGNSHEKAKAAIAQKEADLKLVSALS